MFKRALSCVVACVVLLGCTAEEAAEQQQFNAATSLFDPVRLFSGAVPFPNDGLFLGTTDPTLNIQSALPFVVAANQVDGFSTVAPAFTDLLGFIDLDTANQGAVIVINTGTNPPTALVPGTDFEVQGYPVVDDADGVRIDQKRTRLLIQWLKPLQPSTRYIVAVTRALLDVNGRPAQPGEQFAIAASATPVAQQSAPILDAMTPEQRATLGQVQAGLVGPTVAALESGGIPRESLVIAFPFTTQSIGKSLDIIQANISPTFLGIQAARNPATGDILTTAAVGLQGAADIYLGALDLNYYQQVPTAENPAAPLSAFWQADPGAADPNGRFLGNPCVNPMTGNPTVMPSESTTTCFPTPRVPEGQAVQRIPVLAMVPNASSGRTKADDEGWPVAIFQHGITRNRGDLFAIADTLAQAGFLALAIDHPLHGVAPCEVGAMGCLRVPGVGERTFDVDYINNETREFVPDTVVDDSGDHYLNLTNLLTGRDNLRQSVADLIQLTASVPSLNLDGNVATNVDASNITFVGHSLGGIAGSVLAGVNPGGAGGIGAMSLVNPGGGIAKLLDGGADPMIGPFLSANLAAAGAIEGADSFETFLRFAQLVIDPGDPINYATRAAANHPIHMVSVDGDRVVANNVPAGPTTTRNHRVVVPGPLSGTDPLAEAMDLNRTPVDAGATMDLILNPEGLDVLAALSTGTHASVLNPAEVPEATVEIQRQVANFLASGGTCLPLGQNCPAPAAQ